MTAKKEFPNITGRPTKYRPEYCQAIIDYFNIQPYYYNDEGEKVVNDFPTLGMFCYSIDIAQKNMLEWVNKHPDFRKAYDIAKTMQENIIVQNGLQNNYHGPFAVFVAKNACGMSDKQQIEVGNIEDKSIKVSFEAAGKEDKQE